MHVDAFMVDDGDRKKLWLDDVDEWVGDANYYAMCVGMD